MVVYTAIFATVAMAYKERCKAELRISVLLAVNAAIGRDAARTPRRSDR
jgi:hypothetical protein